MNENLLILNKLINEIKKIDFIENDLKENYFCLFNKTIPNEIINKIKLKPIYNELFLFYNNIILNLFDLKEFNEDYKNEIEIIILNHLKNSDEIKEKNGLKLILKIFDFDFNFISEKIYFNNEKILNFKEKINFLFENEKNFWLLNLIKNVSNFIINKNNYQIILFYYLIINILIPNSKKLEFENLIKNFNENFQFLSENETLNLINLIKEDFQPEKNFNFDSNEITNNNNEIYDDFQEKIKVDEINDDEIDFEDFEDAEEEEILIKFKENEKKSTENFNSTENNFNSTEKNNNNFIKDDDDNLTLEDLGVKEVDENIFDNFDEENIPILKKNNVRCKGYAAKFKTNQNSRTLLMSEQQQNNLIINKKEKNDEIILENENNDDNNNKDFSDVPDLTQKKKNIRPLNGFRPATPPLRNTNSNNIPNDFGVNNNVFVNNVNNVVVNVKKKNKKKKKIRARSDESLKNKCKKMDEIYYKKNNNNDDFRNTIKKKLNQNQKIVLNFKKINSQREKNKK